MASNPRPVFKSTWNEMEEGMASKRGWGGGEEWWVKARSKAKEFPLALGMA